MHNYKDYVAIAGLRLSSRSIHKIKIYCKYKLRLIVIRSTNRNNTVVSVSQYKPCNYIYSTFIQSRSHT